MKRKEKSLISTMLSIVGMLLLGGPILFFVILMVNLTGPLYLIHTVPLAAGVLLLALVFAAAGILTQRWSRLMWAGVALVWLGCGCYAGYGAWKDSLPTVDDRSLLLREYQPFIEDTKAARLDGPASLQLSPDQARGLRLDGATALYPVYAAFVQAVFPEGDYAYYKSESNVSCSNTVYAYEALIAGEADVIFTAGPSKSQLELAEKAGVQLYLTPIGREAFVFFVNSKNPVTQVKVSDIQDIYSGKLTNWSELGGKNRSIRPFQRDENSGSQTYLQRLMEGLPLMEPEEEDRVGGMGGIIRQVASYRNYSNAIGFSFRFYASEMVANDQIRLLALDGVEPTKQTIRDGSYPLASEFYAVTASPLGQPPPQEENPDLAALLDWILSPEGQELVERTGYVALNAEKAS